jgi:hypothetical protein
MVATRKAFHLFVFILHCFTDRALVETIKGYV